jgi:23S rRNA (uracil1939-C5)-methyltransferase
MVTPGQLLSLTIEKPAAGGRMIARVGGQVVLVGGAIPGERVTGRVERVGRGVAYAATTSVEVASVDRREVFGDPLCGGCVYAHIAYPRQVDIKALVIADAFGRIGRLELPAAVRVAHSPEEGYRMRARLHVRGDHLGFFREGTHALCDVRATRQLLPATCDVLDRVVAGVRPPGIHAVREIEVSENVDASNRVVHLESATALEVRALDAIAALDGLTGATLGCRSAAGSRVTTVAGSAHVVDTVAIGDHAPIELRRHVLAFFQGNRFLLKDLVSHVIGQVEPGSDVIDLYAGAGLFALSAAAIRCARVTAVEGDRFAASDLEANVRAAGGGLTAVHQPVEGFLASSRRAPAALIVDPPRTGMSREAMDGIVRLRAGRIVYVSCDVATLARDVRRLVDGGYTIERVDAFDLFPNTPHVEAVVVLDRT